MNELNGERGKRMDQNPLTEDLTILLKDPSRMGIITITKEGDGSEVVRYNGQIVKKIQGGISFDDL